MSTSAYAVSDTMTMLRRNLRHMLRYPALTLMTMGMPIIILLLFVYVFGGTLGAGLEGGSGTRNDYINYLVPGILLMSLSSAATSTSISVAMDMTEGIVARFRTMAIFRPSVLAGHVVGSVIQTMIGVTFVIGVALLIGFRPTADPLSWMAAIALIAVVAVALTWLSVAFGLVSKSVESASNLPTFLILLPFLGSGFVPTDSMATGVRWFAEYQPFTPVIDTLRGLLLGGATGDSAVLAVTWCVAITLLSYIWAKRLFNRDQAQ